MHCQVGISTDSGSQGSIIVLVVDSICRIAVYAIRIVRLCGRRWIAGLPIPIRPPLIRCGAYQYFWSLRRHRLHQIHGAGRKAGGPTVK